jgi:hypothetical protein
VRIVRSLTFATILTGMLPASLKDLCNAYQIPGSAVPSMGRETQQFGRIEILTVIYLLQDKGEGAVQDYARLIRVFGHVNTILTCIKDQLQRGEQSSLCLHHLNSHLSTTTYLQIITQDRVISKTLFLRLIPHPLSLVVS